MKCRNWKGEMVEAPADGKRILHSCFDGYLVWSTNDDGKSMVRYGLEMTTFRLSIQAAQHLGECIYHHAECEGLLD